MTVFILVFGALTCFIGLVITINPQLVFGFLRGYSDKIGIQVAAVALRLLLGVFLILQSGISRYPVAIEIIGWLSIAAAVFIAFMGRRKFVDLMAWALSLVHKVGRVGGIIAIAFGAFLVYAFV